MSKENYRTIMGDPFLNGGMVNMDKPFPTGTSTPIITIELFPHTPPKTIDQIEAMLNLGKGSILSLTINEKSGYYNIELDKNTCFAKIPPLLQQANSIATANKTFYHNGHLDITPETLDALGEKNKGPVQLP